MLITFSVVFAITKKLLRNKKKSLLCQKAQNKREMKKNINHFVVNFTIINRNIRWTENYMVMRGLDLGIQGCSEL